MSSGCAKSPDEDGTERGEFSEWYGRVQRRLREARRGGGAPLCQSGVHSPHYWRTASQDATSVASLLITIDALVAEKPMKQSPSLPTGAGLGDADF